MRQAGQIALVPFPFADLSGTKLRPVLMIRQASTRFDDWLVCMISSKLRQSDPLLDEVLQPGAADFAQSGLKVASVLRLSRLAVLDGALFAGCLGTISDQRLQEIRQRLAAWIVGDNR